MAQMALKFAVDLGASLTNIGICPNFFSVNLAPCRKRGVFLGIIKYSPKIAESRSAQTQIDCYKNSMIDPSLEAASIIALQPRQAPVLDRKAVLDSCGEAKARRLADPHFTAGLQILSKYPRPMGKPDFCKNSKS
jgi:hypothetical protein